MALSSKYSTDLYFKVPLEAKRTWGEDVDAVGEQVRVRRDFGHQCGAVEVAVNVSGTDEK